MKALLALSLLALAGCSALDAKTVEAMSTSQSSLCLNSIVYGQVHYSNMGGKSTGTAGGGGTAKCGVSEVTFTNEGKAGVAPKAAP